jgi:hypothetical protein
MLSMERLYNIYQTVNDWFSSSRAQGYAAVIHLLVPHRQLAGSSCRLQCLLDAWRVVWHAPASLCIKMRMEIQVALSTYITTPPS